MGAPAWHDEVVKMKVLGVFVLVGVLIQGMAASAEQVGLDPEKLGKAFERKYYEDLAKVFSRYCQDFSGGNVMKHTR